MKDRFRAKAVELPRGRAILRFAQDDTRRLARAAEIFPKSEPAPSSRHRRRRKIPATSAIKMAALRRSIRVASYDGDG
jgi:hypothetical protein